MLFQVGQICLENPSANTRAVDTFASRQPIIKIEKRTYSTMHTICYLIKHPTSAKK